MTNATIPINEELRKKRKKAKDHIKPERKYAMKLLRTILNNPTANIEDYRTSVVELMRAVDTHRVKAQ